MIGARGLDRLFGAMVPLSFSAIGYRVAASGWDDRDLEVDLSGRVCAVTGATSGIGRAAALALAGLGARVLLLVRDRARGEATADELRIATGNPAVEVVEADLADLASVRRAVAEVRALAPALHALVHNAGLLVDTFDVTVDGLERTVATHVVGPHLLTRELAGPLVAEGDARVVWVSSGGMYTRRLDVRRTFEPTRPFDGVTAYARTKRAQVVLAELWAERLADRDVVVHAMHPGWVDTPGLRSSLPGFARATRPILRDVRQGADTVVWLVAAAAASRTTGRFWLDRRQRTTHLLPGTREHDDERRALWSACEDLTAGDA